MGLWAIIIKQKVIILDSKLDTATTFHPQGITLPKAVNLEKMNQIHNTEICQKNKPQYILYNGIDHYNSISEGRTIINNQNNNGKNKSKLRRRIEQRRNERITNSNLVRVEKTKR